MMRACGVCVCVLAVCVALATLCTAANNPDEIGWPVSNGRKYYVSNPKVAGSNMPILLFYHGRGGKGQDEGETRSLRIVLENMNFSAIVIGMDGVDHGWDIWGSRDIDYTKEVVADVQKHYSVDPTKVLTIGFSMGSMLSARLICETQNLLYASMFTCCGGGCDHINTPVHLLAIQTTNDGVCGFQTRDTYENIVRATGCNPGSGDQRQLKCQGKEMDLKTIQGGHEQVEKPVGDNVWKMSAAFFHDRIFGNQCDKINCGAHGTCNYGTCICTDGYTGATCTVPPPPGQVSICGTATEGQQLALSCPAGKTITAISFASYGVLDGSCPALAKGSCDASSSVAQVTSACVGKSSCAVAASNDVFGDPCSGTGKALGVVAQCNDGTTPPPPVPSSGPAPPPATTTICATAAEGQQAALSCPAGQTITAISFASYGLPSGSCPSFSAGSCHASSSVAQVQSACVGKSSCSVAASNNVFGDPCSGRGKTLDIAATCA